MADYNNNSIRKVTPAGVVSTFAALSGVRGLADGPGMAARFSSPSGIARDTAGNLWVADAGNGLIRKITPDAIVSTVSVPSRFHYLSGIVIGPTGNIYFTDDQTIRKLTPDGVVTTLAGLAGTSGLRDGSGSQALFDSPKGITLGPNGLILVADTNNSVIRFVTEDGFAGTFSSPPYLERYYSPQDLVMDGSGNVFVTDTGGNDIRKIEAGTGDVTIVAGVVTDRLGSTDGPGAVARFGSPTSITIDNGGNLYVADAKNATIRKIDPAFVVSTLGGLASPGSMEGAGDCARFTAPAGTAVDSFGNTYVADTDNCTIRRITHAGVVSTIAGSPGIYGNVDGNGSAARFSGPEGIAVDGAGNLYVADTFNSSIRKITPTGDVTTVALLFYAQSPGGWEYENPEGVAVDSSGNLYIAATAASAIVKITPDGTQSVFAGWLGRPGPQNGTGSAARFQHPSGIALDVAGNVYVADTWNYSIRKITPEAVVSTLPGGPYYLTQAVAVDGQGPYF